jgi:hypothetical protein
MTITKTIPRDRLSGLDLKQGDTLRIVACMESDVVIQIDRTDVVRGSGKAAEWLETAKGIVRLADGESADDARTAYYVAKYGLEN